MSSGIRPPERALAKPRVAGRHHTTRVGKPRILRCPKLERPRNAIPPLSWLGWQEDGGRPVRGGEAKGCHSLVLESGDAAGVAPAYSVKPAPTFLRNVGGYGGQDNSLERHLIAAPLNSRPLRVHLAAQLSCGLREVARRDEGPTPAPAPSTGSPGRGGPAGSWNRLQSSIGPFSAALKRRSGRCGVSAFGRRDP